MKRYLWSLLAVLLIAATPHSAPSPTMMDLENAPVVMVGGPFTDVTVDLLAFDTLRVIVTWQHPLDSLGLEDSTSFRVQATKTIRFPGGGSVAANSWRRRRFLTNVGSDTFKVLRPLVGDSVVFTVDSIMQCRVGECSVPGSAAWGYRRTARPPAMTFDRILIDSI